MGAGVGSGPFYLPHLRGKSAGVSRSGGLDPDPHSRPEAGAEDWKDSKASWQIIGEERQRNRPTNFSPQKLRPGTRKNPDPVPLGLLIMVAEMVMRAPAPSPPPHSSSLAPNSPAEPRLHTLIRFVSLENKQGSGSKK
jgi:hypothetical protein